MAEISKITLPNNQIYDIKVTSEHIGGQVEIANGGTGASTAEGARTNLGLGSAATYTASSTVSNNNNLPTGAAIQNYVTKHIILSTTQPSNQSDGDIWGILEEI